MAQKLSPLNEHLKKMKNRHRTKAVQERFANESTPKKEDYVTRSFQTEPPPPPFKKKKTSDDF